MQAAPIKGITAVVAVSAPLAMAFETGFRLLLFPPEFHEIRETLRPTLSPWAWADIGLTVAFGLVGSLLLSRSGPATLAKARLEDPERAGKLLIDKLLLTSSIPQVPAIAGTLLFMFGSPLVPILVCMAVSSGFVIVQGAQAHAMMKRNPTGESGVEGPA